MTPRRRVAHRVLHRLRDQYGSLCDQASRVSKECIRVAILWHELWHEALEDGKLKNSLKKKRKDFKKILGLLYMQILPIIDSEFS